MLMCSSGHDHIPSCKVRHRRGGSHSAPGGGMPCRTSTSTVSRPGRPGLVVCCLRERAWLRSAEARRNDA
eukprot:13709501-Heterocapsa_arctica.AAC.1